MPQDPLHTQDLPSRLGRAMLFAAWVVGLAVLVLFFQHQLDDRENPNRDIEAIPDRQG